MRLPAAPVTKRRLVLTKHNSKGHRNSARIAILTRTDRSSRRRARRAVQSATTSSGGFRQRSITTRARTSPSPEATRMFFVTNVTKKREWPTANLSFSTNQHQRNVPTVTAQECDRVSPHFKIRLSETSHYGAGQPTEQMRQVFRPRLSRDGAATDSGIDRGHGQ